MVKSRLTALRFVGMRKSYAYVLYRCECGVEKVIAKDHVLAGKTKSCGCLKQEALVLLHESNVTHGESYSSEYSTWVGMIQRCTVVTNKDYVSYGGRGIGVCSTWLNSFSTFLRDMGKKARPELTLERVDNNAGYCRDNCIWATRKVQANNRRNT